MSRLVKRPDVLLLVGMAAAIVILLAAIIGRDFSRPPPVRADLLPTVAPTATATPGWWASAPVTATPTLTGLPGLPEVRLSVGRVQAGEPVSYETLSCPRADVHIAAVTTAKPGWWDIVGTAAIPNQEYWKGEISADGQHWTLLYQSNQPVQEGLLIQFNTRTVPKGGYRIRLVAVDRTGNYPEPCVIGVTIR